MRILVVEDEARLADYLKKGLTESGYVVDVAADGIDGLHFAVEGSYDAVVLDVMLPGKDGFEVLAGLRARKKTPVLMLTARDAVEDRVKGLTEGADDYLVKPFSFDELLARVQALLRRGGESRDLQVVTALKLADLEVDRARRRATRDGVRLELTPQEFNLLVALMRRRGPAGSVWQFASPRKTLVVATVVPSLCDDGSWCSRSFRQLARCSFVRSIASHRRSPGGTAQVATHAHAAGTDSNSHGSQDHVKDAGPCHLMATPIFAGSTECTAAAGPLEDQWVADALLSFASVTEGSGAGSGRRQEDHGDQQRSQPTRLRDQTRPRQLICGRRRRAGRA